MSNLLEQAIVDAAALKEVALKSAEAALIEKYSKEFKESVEKLLEQEQAEADLSTPETPQQEPVAAAAEENDEEAAFNDVSSSFLEGDDDDVITIDFDQLKKQISSAITPSFPPLASPETAVSGEQTPALAESLELDEESDEELDEELELSEELTEMQDDPTLTDALDGGGPKMEVNEDELEEYELEEDSIYEQEKQTINIESDPEVVKAKQNLAKVQAQTGQQISQAQRDVATATGNAAGRLEQELSEEETIELSEEELQELEEALMVDVKVGNLSDGHMGTTETQKREQRNLELAAARDDDATEARKKEMEEMSDLVKELAESKEENVSLLDKFVEMEENLTFLKENIEKLSISNAKLLYTNKILGDVSLNERQKTQIVENLSKAKTVLEAKTIYNTLQSAVEGAKTSKPKESLSEAIIRGNSSPFLTRKQPKEELSMSERMKILAGIHKKD